MRTMVNQIKIKTKRTGMNQKHNQIKQCPLNPNKAWLFKKEPRNLKSFTAQKGLK